MSPLSESRRHLVETVTRALAAVPNMAAVVLGGSHATGRHTEKSDLDFGLYYNEARPFSIDAIVAVAKGLAADVHGAQPVVTGFYEWGPWVNGGAWIQAAESKIDFLYRNVDHVSRTIDDAVRGKVEHHYGQQPPYGFTSIIYLAETQVAVPLHDPAGELARLKARVAVYPPALRASVIRDSLWSVEFTLCAARSSAEAGDVYSTAGCLTRAAASLTQALFAINETYFLTDKRLERVLGSFARIPSGYLESLKTVLGRVGEGPAELGDSVNRMRALWRGLVALSDGVYEPRYPLSGARMSPMLSRSLSARARRLTPRRGSPS
jgi:hypothetical protein